MLLILNKRDKLKKKWNILPKLNHNQKPLPMVAYQPSATLDNDELNSSNLIISSNRTYNMGKKLKNKFMKPQYKFIIIMGKFFFQINKF